MVTTYEVNCGLLHLYIKNVGNPSTYNVNLKGCFGSQVYVIPNSGIPKLFAIIIFSLLYIFQGLIFNQPSNNKYTTDYFFKN